MANRLNAKAKERLAKCLKTLKGDYQWKDIMVLVRKLRYGKPAKNYPDPNHIDSEPMERLWVAITDDGKDKAMEKLWVHLVERATE
jgi:hypothetical protein